MGVGYIGSKNTLDCFLASLVEDRVIPGGVAAICDRNKVLYSWCGGNRELFPHKLPMLPNTQFDLASLTKVVSTTMVAARLIGMGELALSDRIGTFFASSGNFPNVSVLQLLTHTGGFISEERLWDNLKDSQETIQYILNSQPQCVPGEKVIYSCFGFIILGAILETVFGSSLALAAKELVFQPLGMDRTTYCPHQSAKTFPSGFASTEIDECSGMMLSGIVHDENARFMHGVSGNSGCFSCMDDLVIWAQMLLSEGKSMNGNKFLSTSITDLFSQNLTEGLGDSRSLGFKIIPLGKRGIDEKETLAYGHTGFTGTSVLFVPARKVAVILLTNRVHPSRNEQRLLSLRPIFHEIAMDLADSYQVY